jgi:hypothetical protein
MKTTARLRVTGAPLRLVLARLRTATVAASSPRPAQRLSLHWRRLRRAQAALSRRAGQTAPANVTRLVTIVARQLYESSRPAIFAVTRLHDEHWHSHVALTTMAAAAARPARAAPSGANAAAMGRRPEGRTVVAYRNVLTTGSALVGRDRLTPVGSPRLATIAPSLTLSHHARAIVALAPAARLRAAAMRASLDMDTAADPTVRVGERRRRDTVLPAARRRDEQVAALHAGRRATAATALEGEDRDARPAPRSPLVWRERRVSASAGAADLPAPDARGGQRPAPLPAAAAAGDDVVPRSTEVRAAPRRAAIPAMEDSIVERLTQQVIQRIERRMRIERERRGL